MVLESNIEGRHIGVHRLEMKYTPPVLVFEGCDLLIYGSFDELEQDLEGIDVEDGIYEAFDAIGRVVRLSAAGVERGRFCVSIGETHAHSIEAPPAGASRLHGLLQQHLEAVGRPVPHNARLEDLVTRCLALHK